MLTDIAMICGNCARMRKDLDAILANSNTMVEEVKAIRLLLEKTFAPAPTATDLELLVKETPMAKGTQSTIKCPCIADKKGGYKAVSPPVVFTDANPKTIILQLIDANGQPVALDENDSVQGTCTSDNPALTVSEAGDSLHYAGSIPSPMPPTGTVVNLAATAKGTVKGAPFDGAASVQITINIPPTPTAVDLQIIIGG